MIRTQLDGIQFPPFGSSSPTAFPVGMMIFNQTSGLWIRMFGAFNFADATALANAPAAGNFLWNGGTWDRQRNNNAVNLAAATQPFQTGVALPGEWGVQHEPAVNVQATISKAAGAGAVRHVCRSISATMNAVAAIAAPISLYLRDGATGAGTIMRSWRFIAPIGTTVQVDLPDLNIFGTAATAMTLEWSAAPGAGNFQNVSMSGYDTT
jgi:hypothetical protein